MDKLPGFYKSLNNDEDKTKWVKLINDNPTKAINTYHEAFCVDDAKSKGYCDLLQLFRLLGTLEERKASSMDIKDIKRKVVEIGKNQQTEREQHQDQLNKIVKEMKKLQNTAVDADGTVASVSTSDTVDRQGLEEIHNALIQLDKKIDDSKSKQPAPRSSDNSNQEEVTKLQQQIAKFETEKNHEIETLQNKHLQALEKSKLSVEDINKAKEELEKQVKAMNESTSALNDENNRRIENISMSNEDNIAKIQQLEQKLKDAQTQHKAEMEQLRESTAKIVDNTETEPTDDTSDINATTQEENEQKKKIQKKKRRNPR
jgi:chromosome segregation ATPase